MVERSAHLFGGVLALAVNEDQPPLIHVAAVLLVLDDLCDALTSQALWHHARILESMFEVLLGDVRL